MDGFFFILVILLLIVGGTIISLRLHDQGRLPTYADRDIPDYRSARYVRTAFFIAAALLGTLIAVIVSLINAFLH